jgi:hypothetical protein
MTSLQIAVRRTAGAALLLLTAGCAGTTSGGPVRDAYLSQAPHYASSATGAVMPSAPIGVLPVTFQKHSIRPVLDPPSGPGSALSLLIGEMNAYLDTLAREPDVTFAPVRGETGPNVAATPEAAQAPDVRFGCVLTADLSMFDCPPARSIENSGFRPFQPTRLSVAPATSEWTEWATGTMQNTRTGSLLVLTIDEGIYRPRQDTYLRQKWVEIGTNHMLPIPWFTPIDAVTVLQLTGALVDREGRVVRIGVEGLYARIPRHLENVEVLEEANMQELRTMRRTDLPGQPLAWKVAMQELVRQMTAPTSVVAK